MSNLSTQLFYGFYNLLTFKGKKYIFIATQQNLNGVKMMNNMNFGQDQMEQMTQTATQQAEEMAKMSQSGFDAWMQTTNIWMDNTQNMWKSCTDMMNASREKQAKAMKEFMSCKTLNDMTETSTKIAQATMEDTMSNATAMSEKTIKMCMDSMEPINDQMSKSFQQTMKKAKKAA